MHREASLCRNHPCWMESNDRGQHSEEHGWLLEGSFQVRVCLLVFVEFDSSASVFAPAPLVSSPDQKKKKKEIAH